MGIRKTGAGELDGSGSAGYPGRSGREIPRRGWDEQCEDYVHFVKQRHRVPSQYAEDSGERALAFWFRNQKASLRTGLLLPERVSKMDKLLPGWSSPHRVRPSWDQTLARAVQFKADRGRWPSSMSPDDDERTLANWLYRQSATRTANRDRKHTERMAKLKNALPDWHSRSPGDNERWTRHLEQVLEHLRTHGRLPVMGPSSSAEEYALGKWMAVQRHARKKGQLYPERAERLDRLVPGWRRITSQPPELRADDPAEAC